MKKIVVVAGLGTMGPELELVVAWWKKEGLEPIVFVPGWDNSEGIEPKITRLLELIDNEKPNYLMGISAGASLALNVFLKKQDLVEKYVSVCGRLRMGLSNNIIERKLQEETLRTRAFKESVELLEKSEILNIDKMMTVSAIGGDELIPINTSQIDGATNIVVPNLGHLLTITSILTNNFGEIKIFLEKE